jgi:hypothetical protein
MIKDPRQIIARFDSKCAETGKPIKKGDSCIYYPVGKKVFHLDSKQADSFRAWQFDINMLGANY